MTLDDIAESIADRTKEMAEATKVITELREKVAVLEKVEAEAVRHASTCDSAGSLRYALEIAREVSDG